MPLNSLQHYLLLLFLAGLSLALLTAVLTMPSTPSHLVDLTQANLKASGVSHPVTAVLLNYRSYDTLLEIAVLLLALLGVWAVFYASPAEPEFRFAPDSPLLITLLRFVLPLIVLMGGYVLWAGAHQPGGAFQAGALLAGLGVLLRLTNQLAPAPFATQELRVFLGIGLAIFVSVALVVIPVTGTLLQYPPEWAKSLIILIEGTLTVSIAVTLFMLFINSPGFNVHKLDQ